MASDVNEAPQTLEGYYVLHDAWHIDWPRWRALPAGARMAATESVVDALAEAAKAGVGAGDTGVYAVIGQRADLLFIHYRETVDGLKQAELALRALPIAEHLRPAGSYLSMIEASLYEATAVAQKKLTDQGLRPDQPAWAEAFEREMAVQRKRLEGRLRPPLSSARYVCFYPMSKRRGERDNWYALPLEERRALMRGHGRIGHRWHQEITQVVSGSIGLDDWEWAVDLHGDDPLAFKKLVTEMRFDPASSRFAEFGPFLLGRRLQPAELVAFLDGRMPR